MKTMSFLYQLHHFFRVAHNPANKLYVCSLRCLTILYFFACFTPVFAQFDISKRLEIPKTEGKDEEYEVFNLGKEGILIQKAQDTYGGKEDWTFTKYDTEFRALWISTFRVDYNIGEFTRSYQNQQFIFWLFTQEQSSEISILRLDLSTGEQEHFKGKLLDILEKIDDFRVLGNQAFIAGEQRSRAVVATFSFFDSSAKYLKGLYNKDAQITNIETNDARNELQVTVRERKNGKCGLSVKTYTYEGELLRTLQAKDEEGKSLISGKILPISETEALLIGNYSSFCTNNALGFYVSFLREGEVGQPRFVQFSELKNFFNFLKPKRQQRIKDKIERKKQEGKEFDFQYMLLISKLLPTADGSLLVAEAYYAQQRSSSPAGFMRFDPPNRNLEQYKFTHVVLCGFDKEGNLTWDNCVKTPDLESFYLEPQVQMTEKNGQWILGYVVKDKVFTQIAQKDKLPSDSQEFSLKYEPRIDSIEDNQVAAWYDDYFLAFGKQRVNTGNEKNAKFETLFCLTKMKYK